MAATSHRAVRVALVNDYEVVLAGLARMLEPYRDRIEVVESDAGARVDEPVDVALVDAFARTEPDIDAVARFVRNPMNRRVALYTWALQQELIDTAVRQGVSGYLAKSLAAADLADAIERIDRGERVLSAARARTSSNPRLDWPGRSQGVSEREAEILALITQGRSNASISTLVHLSPNTVKTHIRSAYRKIGATNRVEAVIWGTDHGFRLDHRVRRGSGPSGGD